MPKPKNRLQTNWLAKAKKYAFLLLRYRPRSEREIYQRLKQKKFEEVVIKETLLFLKGRSLIDDSCFAKDWIESRLKKPFGIKKIREELKLKGISEEIIDSRIQEAEKEYCEEETAGKLARQRFDRLKDVGPQKAKRRVLAYLLRRGFSEGISLDAVGDL